MGDSSKTWDFLGCLGGTIGICFRNLHPRRIQQKRTSNFTVKFVMTLTFRKVGFFHHRADYILFGRPYICIHDSTIFEYFFGLQINKGSITPFACFEQPHRFRIAVDHVEFIGPCSMGERNERGNALIEFVLEEGLCIFNQMDMSHVNDS